MQLKDVMYDADDVIDLCQIKAKEHLAGSSSRSSSNSCCGRRLFSCTLASAIRSLLMRLVPNQEYQFEARENCQEKADLGLTESQIFSRPSDRVRRVNSIISRKTDPSIVPVNWVTEEEKGLRENVGVAAIVGMGGIWKTTLAQRTSPNQLE